jgi:hypothetical protein
LAAGERPISIFRQRATGISSSMLPVLQADKRCLRAHFPAI